MAPVRYSLDTNAWSEVLQKNLSFVARFEDAASRAEIVLCPVVFYEVRRGLLHAEKTRQLTAFEDLVARCTWLDLSREIWLEMTLLWADLKRRAISPEDADLAIGVHARHFSAIVVTHNVKHFEYLGVEIEDWLRD